MPLSKSRSLGAFKKNIGELVKSKAGATRQKGINTLARKQGISTESAKKKQAAVIAFNIKRGPRT